MRFGICTDLEHIREVAEAGFDYIEPKGSDIARMAEEDFQKLLSEKDRLPIPIESVNFFYPGDMKVVGPEADMEKVFGYIETAIRRFGALDVKMVTVGGSGPRKIPEGFPREEAVKQFVSEMQYIGDLAAAYPTMTVAIEPIRPASTNFINSIAEGVGICRLVNRPNVRVMADCNQMYFANDPIGSITKYGNELSHLHTIDVLNGNTYPTDPENPHQNELIKAYAAAVPNGRISIEGAPFTTVETAVKAKRALDAYVENAGGGKKIFIGNDHGGTVLKNQLVKWLQDRGYTVVNVGTDDTDIVRYPYYAAKVCRAVQEGKAWRGILICSTGIGMSMIANKYRGIRAALCTDTYMGRLTRAHNDSNVLCLGGRITGDFEAIDILDVWLKTPYEGGRHNISLGLIRGAEEQMITGEPWKGEEV